MLEKCVRQKFFSFSSKFRLPSKCFQISFKTISHAGSMPCIILWFASRPDTIEIKRVFFSFLYSLTAPPYFFTSGYPRAQKLFFFFSHTRSERQAYRPRSNKRTKESFLSPFSFAVFPFTDHACERLIFPPFSDGKRIIFKESYSSFRVWGPLLECHAPYF